MAASSRTVLDTILINDQEIEVVVGKHGSFSTFRPDEPNHSIATGDRLENVIEQTKAKLRQTRKQVSIDFYDFGGVKGRAYSIHAGNGSPMVELGGKRETYTVSSYGGRPNALKGDTPQAILDRLVAIGDEEAALKAEREAIHGEFGINLKGVVTRAMREANSEEDGDGDGSS
jgi:hypothetical protein